MRVHGTLHMKSGTPSLDGGTLFESSREGRVDVDAPALRWLCGALQARLTHLPARLRAQSLQRAGAVCQSVGEPAVYANRLVIAAEGQIVCEHQRLIERNHHGSGQTVYDWRHYLAVLQRKPGAASGFQATAGQLDQANRQRPGDGGGTGTGAAPRLTSCARRSGAGTGVRGCPASPT